MKKYKLLVLSLSSSIILSLAWPCIGDLAPLILFAFVPLLFVENYIFQNPSTHNNYHLFKYSFIAFFFWNLFTTWWIYNASLFGVIMAVLLNALYMSCVFLFFHVARKVLGLSIAFISLIITWIAFEYLHLNWDLSWPWLTLGNSFANFPQFIQWYEYTGVLGGSLWILIVNVLFFIIIKKFFVDKESVKNNWLELVITFLLIALPLMISLTLYQNYHEVEAPVDVVLVQPNSDPMHEKFRLSEQQHLDRLLNLSQSKLDSNVDYLIFPETALIGELWENQMDQSYSVIRLNQFLKGYPNLNVVSGISSNRAYENKESRSPTARKFLNADAYYDSYNTALQLDASSKIQIYHKSKLVPGVEQTPFPAVFGHLDFLAVELGGTVGSLAKDNERKVFPSSDSRFKTAPVICYESVFGEFVGEYVRNGANLLFIITNDGWWGDTPGYKQHFNYARLRAIETRRCIARSGNTGISAYFNQKGVVLQESKWWEQAVLRKKINVSDKITFYTFYGDYIGRIAALIFLLLFGSIVCLHFIKVKKSSLR